MGSNKKTDKRKKEKRIWLEWKEKKNKAQLYVAATEGDGKGQKLVQLVQWSQQANWVNEG